jgi:hypothetical protein
MLKLGWLATLTLLAVLALPQIALADPVIAQGTVVVKQSGGAFLDEPPPPAQAEVGVFFSPGGADGTTQDDTLVGTATTGADGSFTVTSENSEVLQSAAADNGGYINLDVLANVNGDTYFEPITRQYLGGTWVDEDGNAPADLIMQSDKVTRNNEPTTGGGTYGAQPYNGCIRRDTKLESHTGWTVIGELHNASDVRSSFTYGRRADSTVSRAYSLDGSTWKLKGTVKIGNDKGESGGGFLDYTQSADNWGHLLESQFVYTKVKHELTCASPFATIITDYSIEPTKWVGGSRVGADVSQFDHQCATTYSQWKTPFASGSTFTRDRSKYTTFNSAASVSFGGIGFNFNASSGMSQWVTQSWTFGSQIAQHWLCGSNDYPIGAKRVFAGI